MASFTPLTPASVTGLESVPVVDVTKPVAPSAFQSLSQVHPASNGIKSSEAPAAPNHACGSVPPTVQLQRHDGQITRIRVQCGCGNVIELDCVY